MAYTITLSNGTALPVVLDGVTDTTSTSITLIGKNYVGYGAFLNQNFAKLLENFSNSAAPANPLTGQIWWDSNQKILKVFTGTGWKNLASSTVGATAPGTPAIGDQWFDTSVGQLKAWDGTTWLTIGPAFTSGQGISGAIAETITDNLGAAHVVVRFYISGVTVGILSKDATFTPSTAILGFSTVKPGMNLSTASNFLYYNDAFNATNLGGIAAANYARTDTAVTFNSTVGIANNGGLSIGSSAGGDFTASITSTAVNLKSAITGKSLNLIAAGQTNPSLSVASGTGYVTVSSDPVSSFGIATKQYVDNAVNLALTGSTDVLVRNGANTVTGVLTPDVTATRDFGTSSLRFAKIYATGTNIAGQVELTGGASGIKFSDGTVQTTAATSPAAGSITPDRLSSGGPYWAGNGNVGIGTSSPTSSLDVFVSSGFAVAKVRSGSNQTYIAADSSLSYCGTFSNIPLVLVTNNVEKMRITADGNVGIGRAAPAIGFKVDVAGQIAAEYPTGLSTNFNDQGSTGAPFYTSATTGGSSFIPLAKIRMFGATQTRTVSYGALHNTDNTIDACIQSINPLDSSNQRYWLFRQDGSIRFPDGTVQATAGSGLGVGQTWSNLTSSRANGTTYTNTTSRPIMVMVNFNGVANAADILVSGVAIASCTVGGAVGYNLPLIAIVPIGATYSVASGGATISRWMEFR